MGRKNLVLRSGFALAAVMVAVAVTSNQAYSGGELSWPWLLAAFVTAWLTVGIQSWLARPIPRQFLALADDHGNPPLLLSASLFHLGVHPNRYWTGGLDGYVEREADVPLAEALQDPARIVLVHGSALAGCSRTLAQVASAFLPEQRVLIPKLEPELAWDDVLQLAGAWAARESGAVLWVDGMTVQETVGLAASIDRQGLPTGVYVLATAHTNVITSPALPATARLLVNRASKVCVGPLSPRERRRLADVPAYADVLPALEGSPGQLMGRLLVSLDRVTLALLPSDAESLERIALLHLVTDWARAEVPRRLTPKRLRRLFEDYWREAHGVDRKSPVPTAAFKRAMEWATAPEGIDRPQLVTPVAVSGGVHHRPHPLLIEVAEGASRDHGWPVSEYLWSYVEHKLQAHELALLGLQAYGRGDYRRAARLLGLSGAAAGDLDVEVVIMLAEWLDGHGDVEGARRWYLRAISSQDSDIAPRGMHGLAVLEQRDGNPGQARARYAQTISTGHRKHAPKAMNDLGLFEDLQGETERARQWFREAIRSEHPEVAPDAMFNLAAIELREDRIEEARKVLTRALESGHAARAKRGLAILEAKCGNPQAARRWFTEAIESGHEEYAPRAMHDLAVFEGGQQELQTARHWFIEASRSGHRDCAPDAMNHLGILEMEKGDPDEARRWLAAAIRSGHQKYAPEAMKNLGFLEIQQGEFQEARRWFTEAIRSGNPDVESYSRLALAKLEEEAGRLEPARRLYAEVIGSGDADVAPDAMAHLGSLEYQVRNLVEARHWLTEAIRSGHHRAAPVAMGQLADLALREGHTDEARHWYAAAIESSVPEVSQMARGRLQSLDKAQREHERARNAIRRGY